MPGRLLRKCLTVHNGAALIPEKLPNKNRDENLLPMRTTREGFLLVIGVILARVSKNAKNGLTLAQIYDGINLVLAAERAAESFHGGWRPRLGLCGLVFLSCKQPLPNARKRPVIRTYCHASN